MRFVKMCCTECGSDEVQADAYAEWNPTTQEWELTTTFDKGSVCEPCGGETRIEEVPLQGEELHNARAYRWAIENGWIPNEAPAGKEAPKKVESSADDNLFVIAHELSKLSEAQMRADGRIKNIHDRLEVLHDNIADVLGIIHTTKKRNPRK